MRNPASIAVAVVACLAMETGAGPARVGPEAASAGSPSTAVVNETPLGQIDLPYRHRFRESPDGLGLAWHVPVGERTAVAVNGQPGPPFDEIGGIAHTRGCLLSELCAVFSPDSRHVAYYGRRGKRWHVVVEDEVGPGYDRLGVFERTFFSQKGGHYAYAATVRKAECVVHDGRQGSLYDSISFPVLSPHGHRVAYVAEEKGRQVVVLNGREVGRAQQIDGHTLTFSLDGKHFAYARMEPDRAVIVDGEPWPLDGGVALGGPLFSPDRRHLAYVDAVPSKYWSRKCRVVFDGRPGKWYPAIGTLSFTPDGSRVCYGASIERRGESGPGRHGRSGVAGVRRRLAPSQ